WGDQALYPSGLTPAERARRQFVLLHEMAHMWFGDLVTLKWWDSLWLNESFADWAGFTALSALRGSDVPWAHYLLTHKIRGYAADGAPTTHPICVDIPDVETAEASFDMITYAKGAGVLRQLVAWLGEDVFAAGLREYFASFGWGNADLADLLARLRAASGRDVDAWAAQWLRTSGTNTLTVGVAAAEGRYDSVALGQDGEPKRTHRMLLGRYSAGPGGALVPGPAIDLEVSAAAQTPVPGLAGEPVGVLVPNDGDWAFARVRYDAASLAALPGLAHTLPSTLSRAGVVVALRELVIAGDLGVADFVDCALRCVAVEPDPAAVAQLLAMCVELAKQFAPRGELLAILGAIASVAGDAWRAERDGELRLSYELILAECASTEAQLAELRSLVAGAGTRQRVRWACLLRLAIFDQVSDEEIEREIARDPDANAATRGAAVRAARPRARAKADALRAMLAPAASPLARELLAGGLWQPEQEELLRPVAEDYLRLMPAVATDPNAPLQGSLIKRTFPRFGPDFSFLAAVSELAAGMDAPLMMRNTLRDEIYHLETALRVRAPVRTDPKEES
ncbi:MAG: ERAP1-like C-terminal domain-containing protein, partial [Actinomycetia bacterium]|nr:ERAP1-like C-terminal domain-containing protein [Actinomycetes bacterium]